MTPTVEIPRRRLAAFALHLWALLLFNGQITLSDESGEATTQTLVCDHSFHSKCLAEFLMPNKSSFPPSCPLCRGEVVLRSPFDLCERAVHGLEVIQSLAAKGLVSWDDLPPKTRTSMLKVIRRFSEAAYRGLASAQHNLGLLYASGLGVTQDFTEAASWYRKAAN
jgi:hypothetical protein